MEFMWLWLDMIFAVLIFVIASGCWIKASNMSEEKDRSGRDLFCWYGAFTVLLALSFALAISGFKEF